MKIRTFASIFFGVIAYMYTATVANYVGYTYSIFQFGDRRAPILILDIIFGLVYMAYKKNLQLSLSNYKKTSLILACYMVFRGFQTTNTAAWFSCVALWALIIVIIGNLSFSQSELQMISTIFCISGIFMSIFYITGNRNSTFVSTVAGSNSIYYILCLVPWAMLQERKILKYSVGLMVVLATFFSAKGTCLTALMAIGIYLGYENRVLIKHNSKKIISFIAGGLALVLITDTWLKSLNMGISIDKIIQELFTEVSGGGNGRSTIYRALVQAFWDSSVTDMIIGHGFNSVPKVLHIGSHNDFLMILYDYGMIGFMFYLAFWRSLIKKRKQLAEGSAEKIAYVSSVIIFIFVSMFSNVINTQIQFLLLCTFWGCMSSQRMSKYEVT